jgi:hypothetical protein
MSGGYDVAILGDTAFNGTGQQCQAIAAAIVNYFGGQRHAQ